MNLLIILLPMADYDDQLLPVHPGGGGEPRSHLAGERRGLATPLRIESKIWVP